MSKEMRNRKIANTVILAIMSIVAVGQLFPLVWLINFSLCKSGDLFASGILKWPNPPQFKNYIIAWNDGKVGPFLINSIVTNGLALLITVILALTLGYAFTRMEWKFRKTCMTIMLLGMMIPIHATLLPNFMIFNKIRLTDTLWGLLIPYVAFSLPMGIFLMSGFLESVPRALEESAIMDGCGVYGIIFRIVFPLTKPAVITISIMTFLNNWNEFIMAATYLSSDKHKTLPFSVLKFAGQYASNYAVQFAVMVFAALPAVLVYILLNEHITKGVTVGAVKG